MNHSCVPFCHDAMWRRERLSGKWRKGIENVRQPSSRNTENKRRDNEWSDLLIRRMDDQLMVGRLKTWSVPDFSPRFHFPPAFVSDTQNCSSPSMHHVLCGNNCASIEAQSRGQPHRTFLGVELFDAHVKNGQPVQGLDPLGELATIFQISRSNSIKGNVRLHGLLH